LSIFRRIIDIARAEIGNRRRGQRPPRDHGSDHQHREHRAPPPPPPPEPDDPLAQAYAALEVPRTATLAEVKKAWRNQLRKYHPDIHSSDAEKQALAHEVSQQLNDAYDLIEKHLGG